MWTYSQTDGTLWAPCGGRIAVGYSGHGVGKNNPKHQAIRSVGPIPQGMYVIGDAYASGTVGPVALPLLPHNHTAFGRTYFRAHGDSRQHPGEASKGCVVLPRPVRERIRDAGCRLFWVIE